MKKKHIFPIAVVCAIFLLALVLVPISSDPENPYSKINLVDRFVLNKKVEDTSKQVTILLGGDVMLGRTVMTTSLDKDTPNYPFLGISGVTQSADLFFVNLENPIIESCPRHFEGFTFCADPRMVDGLVYSGVDIVTLANNHSSNYGEEGLAQTKDYLTEAGIGYVGNGRLEIREMNGIKFGFLGFNFLSAIPTDEDYSLIRNSKSQVDVLILGVHWGTEYTEAPSERQSEWAEKFVAAGADVISGHHAHWVQTIANINGSPVYYSLGNLVFDQMWSEKTREGLMIKLTFENGDIVDEEFIKTYMEKWAQPVIVN